MVSSAIEGPVAAQVCCRSLSLLSCPCLPLSCHVSLHCVFTHQALCVSAPVCCRLLRPLKRFLARLLPPTQLRCAASLDNTPRVMAAAAPHAWHMACCIPEDRTHELKGLPLGLATVQSMILQSFHVACCRLLRPHNWFLVQPKAPSQLRCAASLDNTPRVMAAAAPHAWHLHCVAWLLH